MKKLQFLGLIAGVALIAGCTTYREQAGYSKRVNFDQLPPAAQTSIRNEIGNQQIARIDEDTKFGEPAYRVEVEKPGPNPALWVSRDGSVLKESRRITAGRQVNEASGAQPSTRVSPND